MDIPKEEAKPKTMLKEKFVVVKALTLKIERHLKSTSGKWQEYELNTQKF